MFMQRVIDIVIFIDGEVGTHTWLLSPGVDPITDKINDRFIGLVPLLAPHPRKCPPGPRISSFPGFAPGFGWLLELNRGKPPGVSPALVPPQDRRCVLELCR